MAVRQAQNQMNEKPTFQPSVSRHRLRETIAVILTMETSNAQEYSFA
jgi:hypothetical protein